MQVNDWRITLRFSVSSLMFVANSHSAKWNQFKLVIIKVAYFENLSNWFNRMDVDGKENDEKRTKKKLPMAVL